MRTKYWVSDWKVDVVLQEKIAREFLLKAADKISLAKRTWSEIGFFYYKKQATENDPAFIKVKDNLQKDFIKKEKNNIREGIAQGKKNKIEHYYYHLSPELKKLFEEETLFWNMFPQLPNSRFYGFENPMFYQGEELLGGVISDERYIYLYLTEKEKAQLEKKGLILNPETN